MESDSPDALTSLSSVPPNPSFGDVDRVGEGSGQDGNNKGKGQCP